MALSHHRQQRAEHRPAETLRRFEDRTDSFIRHARLAVAAGPLEWLEILELHRLVLLTVQTQKRLSLLHRVVHIGADRVDPAAETVGPREGGPPREDAPALRTRAGADQYASGLAGKEVINSEVEIVMPLGEQIDASAEAARIKKDIGKAEKEIGGLEKKLGNADFLARAPEEVVAEQRARLAEEKVRLQRMTDALATLEKAGKKGA